MYNNHEKKQGFYYSKIPLSDESCCPIILNTRYSTVIRTTSRELHLQTCLEKEEIIDVIFSDSMIFKIILF